MTSAQETLKLLMAYQRLSDFLTKLADERSELGALAKERLPDLETLRLKAFRFPN